MNNVRVVQLRYPHALRALAICVLGLLASSVPALCQTKEVAPSAAPKDLAPNALGAALLQLEAPRPPPAQTSAPASTTPCTGGVCDVWEYIDGPLSTPPTGGITFVGPPPQAAPGPGQTIFTDNFQTLDPTWGAPDAATTLQNGAMVIKAVAGGEYSRYSSKFMLPQVDMAATVVAEPGTQQLSAGGLIIWAEANSSNKTSFLIDPIQGSFAVTQTVGNNVNTIVNWAITPTLNTGVGKANRLEVVAGASQAIFLINGHQVAEMAAPASPGGYVGFDADGSASAPAQFAFSDFSAKVPSTSALPPGTVAAPVVASGQTIFADDFQTLDPSWGVSGPLSSVANGILQLRGPMQNGIALLNNKYAYQQAVIEVTAAEAAGSGSDSYLGLLFWSADANNYVMFALDPRNGAFAVFQVQAEAQKSTPLLNWQNSADINIGVGKANALAVVLQQGKAFFLINGHQVGQIAALSNPPGQLVGLLASAGAQGPANYDFSNFAVLAPNADGALPRLATAPAVAPSTTASSSAPSPPPSAAPSTPFSAGAGAPPMTPFVPAQAQTSQTDIPPPPAQALGANETLAFSDDFQTYGPSWGKPDNVVFTRNGRLVAQVAGKGFGYRLNGAYRYYDSDLSFSGRVVSGSTNSGVELLFWLQDMENYYYLFVGANGTFAIDRLVAGNVSQIVPMQSSATIKTGLGAWNAITLATRGAAGTLSFNGTVVAQLEGGPPPSGGAFGLVGNSFGPGTSTIEFAHLRVGVPNPVKLTRGWSPILAAAPIPAPSTAPGAPILVDNFQSFDPSWGAATGLVTVDAGKLGEGNLNGGASGTTSYKYLYGDADIQLSAYLAESPQMDTTASLFFWEKMDLSDYYVVGVSPLGYFHISHWSGGKMTNLAAWQGTAALRQGVGQSNEIAVSLRGTQGTLVINGATITQFTGGPPAGGGVIGVSMLASKSGATIWDFSNLQVLAPAAAQAAAR